MMRCILVTLAAILAASHHLGPVDPGVRAAVERLYAAREAEDADAYFALWSRTAQRPRPEEINYLFASGDDKFSSIAIAHTLTVSDQIIVRVSVVRDRTSATTRGADGSPAISHATLTASLTFVREDGDWKLLAEGTAVDGLAMALLVTPTIEERERLRDAEPGLAGLGLLSALSRRADEFAQSGQYARAQTIYERVVETARRTGHKKEEGEALQKTANAMYYQRNFTAALSAYEQRLALERQAGNEEGIAGALLGVATIFATRFSIMRRRSRAIARCWRSRSGGRAQALPRRSSAPGTCTSFRETCRLRLADFFSRVQAGETPDAALQAARAAIRGRADTRAPQFWAGWLLIGT